MPRSSRATSPGRSVLLAESANVSAVPSTNRTTRTTAMLIAAADDRGDEDDQHDGTAEVDDDDHPPPVESGRRSRRRGRRTAATGRYSLSTAIETRNGSRVCEATSSGPAASAMPSPMLLTNVADSSQRKLRPSRVGAMVSVIRGGSGSHRRQDTNRLRRARGALRRDDHLAPWSARRRPSEAPRRPRSAGSADRWPA